MRTADFAAAATLALICVAAGAPVATAQGAYANAPFQEHPVAAAQAAAIERVALRTRALAAFDPPPEDLVEETGKIRSRDLPYFIMSLGAVSPQVADGLVAAVETLLDRAETGEPVADAAEGVLGLAGQARAALVPADLAGRADFDAATMATLLLADDGVAEAYEESAEGEVWEYPAGWAALQRVKELWSGLRPAATEEAAFEIDAMLGQLDALMAAATPPERFAADPEEPESHAHRLVGFLETVADAGLYPGRDLGGAAGMVGAVAASGCEAPDPAVGVELVSIAGRYYDETLAGPLSVLATGAHDRASEVFETLDARGDGLAAACAGLLAALETARTALPPAATE